MNVLRRSLASVVWLALAARVVAQPYVAGQTYFGRSNYIEYIAGNLPLIVSAPHGGALVPAELPDRTTNAPWTNAVLGTDTATETLARDVRQVFSNRFGLWPHVILCRLDRQKIDCNREVGEGAQGNALTGVAWTNFQDFIAAAKVAVSNQFGRGFYIDLHGHGHAIQRLELGYLLSAGQLTNSDATLNANANYADQSSVRELNQRSPFAFATLLRGSNALGTLLAGNGFPSVPGAADPEPGAGNPYFNGGYNTDAHGSVNGGTISGVQIECNYTNVRNTPAARLNFATNLAAALEVYFSNHFAMNLRDAAPSISALGSRTVGAESSTGPLAFTVADDLTPPGSLVVTRASSDANLVPTNGIVLGGGGSNRTVTVTPATNRSGTATITLTVTDTNGGMGSAALALTVTAVNHAPVLAGIANVAVNAGQVVAFTNAAGDVDVPAQLLTFGLVTNPPGAVLDAGSGVFNWRPALAQAGTTNVVAVRVFDDGVPSLGATQSFRVTVRALTNPPAGAVQWSNGAWRVTVSGPAGPDYTVQAATNLPDWTNLLVTNAPAVPFGFTDTNAGSYLRRFYRVLLGP